jgi:hypothetical protein
MLYHFLADFLMSFAAVEFHISVPIFILITMSQESRDCVRLWLPRHTIRTPRLVQLLAHRCVYPLCPLVGNNYRCWNEQNLHSVEVVIHQKCETDKAKITLGAWLVLAHAEWALMLWTRGLIGPWLVISCGAREALLSCSQQCCRYRSWLDRCHQLQSVHSEST